VSRVNSASSYVIVFDCYRYSGNGRLVCDEDSPRKANDSSALLDDLTEADSHDTECRAGHICSNSGRLCQLSMTPWLQQLWRCRSVCPDSPKSSLVPKVS